MKKILIGYISNTKGSGLDNYIYHLVDILKGEDVQIDLLSSAIDQELKDKYKADSNIPNAMRSKTNMISLISMFRNHLIVSEILLANILFRKLSRIVTVQEMIMKTRLKEKFRK